MFLRRPRRRRRGRAPRGLLLLSLLFVLLLGASFLVWAESPPGRMALADRGVPTARSWARGELERQILDALELSGVSPESTLVSSPDPARRVTVRAQSAIDFLQLNLALTERIEGAGGRVHRGRRLDAERGATLELEIGTQRQVTHRVLLLRGPAPIEPPPPPRGRLALVIDDWGHNLSPPALRLLRLEAPLTLAILPELRYSRRVLTEAIRHDKRAILHLPMEPRPDAGKSPGQAAIELGMEPEEIRALTERFLDGLQGVAGVNNHMGSLATESRELVRPMLQVVAVRGLFFLDSVTTPRSVAGSEARELGIPSASNDLFLDVDTEDPEVVEKRLWKLIERARDRGYAIGIGHVNEATASALEKVLPELDPADVQLVALDELVHSLPD